MTQNRGPTGIVWRAISHVWSWFEGPVVHADFAAASALAAAHQDGAAARVEVELAEIERFLDAQSRAPEHDDQPASSIAVETVAGAAHHGDDLLRARRVGRIATPIVM